MPLSEFTLNITDGKHGDCVNEVNSGYYFLSVKDIKQYNIDYKNARQITEADFIETHKRTKLEKGDILLANSGHTIGKMLYVRESPFIKKSTFQKSVAIIKPDSSKVDGSYLFYNLLANVEGLRRAAVGSAQPNLLLGDLRNFQVSIEKERPSQVLISKILSDLDKKIALNNKINTELESMAKLIYDYWFVQFDFPDANGKPYKSSGGKMVYNEALKREIPEGWEVKELSSILKSNYASIGKNHSFQEIEYLDTGSLTKNVIEGTENINTMQDKAPSRAKRIVQKNDILYSTVRPKLCHYGIVKNPIQNMVASTGFVQLTSRIPAIGNDLIYTFLTSSWVTSRLQQIATLAVSAYPSISPNDILELHIALPKDEKLVAPINVQLESIYSKVALNQQENMALTDLRDWLLPMLMNGQVTIKNTAS